MGRGAVGIDIKAVVRLLLRLATERARVLRNLARLRGPFAHGLHAAYSGLVYAIPAPSVTGCLSF